MATQQARYRQVAAELRRAIAEEIYGSGGRLPSESALAERYAVSRGTVRQALAVLRNDGVVTSRRGTRRVVLDNPPLQDFSELTSFTGWARSLGEQPGGSVVHQERRAATEEEQHQLRLGPDGEVLWVLRLRTLSGRPVMVERTSYPPAVGALVEAMPTEAVSVTDLLARHGVLLVDADHTIDLVHAEAQDAELLGCAAGAPLLRERRRATDPAGVPVEWSEDRYLPGTVAFTVHNSSASTVLTRSRTGGGATSAS
ncbi:GntR family transcriptional regulator [Streptacidiphilus sp. EB129]|uniref:GntR family transcriptional regulator n=1 Tax=Streptacidiphilus sp. EB129 TaxID=3156262 RepID=UPI0035121C95